MYITSETCRADSVIKTAQNNLHQAGPSKPIYNDAWGEKKKKLYIYIYIYIYLIYVCVSIIYCSVPVKQ